MSFIVPNLSKLNFLKDFDVKKQLNYLPISELKK
ncbi:hypothetical protein CLU97_4358 [Chryseobacterium sp. 7]|nr:hypothetical protein CLU97_4358 [Chryseobacterium sp. 7]